MTPQRRPFLIAALLLSALLILGSVPAWSESSQGDEETVVASYVIVKGIIRPDPGVSVAASQKKLYDKVGTYVWNAVPPDCKSLVDRLELFVTPADAENPSDGTATPNDDGSRWTLSFSWDEAESAVIEQNADDEEVFDEVIVHELGHVLSLKTDQMTEDASLGTYSDSDGTFAKDAYLNVFYQEFWKGKYPDETDNGKDPAQTSALYDAHPGAFVTEYAATDPTEDFAESFASFVLKIKPAAGTERSRKIQFFYAYPELLKDRAYLRNILDSTR
jgi:hypothetical protein